MPEKKRTVNIVDLFCGAGGTSTGVKKACVALGYKVKLTAVNHWKLAIATHSQNHIDDEHLCTDVESVVPEEVVPGGVLDLLVASPECTHFANARGGKPVNDQKRAGARYVLDWAEKLYVKNILLENVREFKNWGPLHTNPNSKYFSKPIKAREGQFFYSFIRDLEAMDYVVDFRVLNAADYGAPTTRERLFLQARKKVRGVRVQITWPEPTHKKPGSEGQASMFNDTRKPWRGAREIIDWQIPSRSMFDPKRKPLAITTIMRIWAGFDKWGENGVPFKLAIEKHLADRGLTCDSSTGKPGAIDPESGKFVVTLRNNLNAGRIDCPLPTITAGGNQIGVAEGAVVPVQLKQNCLNLDEPMPTVTATSSDFAVAEGFLVKLNHTKPRTYPTDRPMHTITSEDTTGLVQTEGFLITAAHGSETHGGRIHSLDNPLGTVLGSNRFGVVSPFITTAGGTEGQGRNARSVDEPIGTVLPNDRRALVQGSIIVPTNHGSSDRSYPLDRPLPTVTAFDALGFAQGEARGFLTTFYGTGGPKDISEPLDTVTAKDRFGLVSGHGVLVTTEDGTKLAVDIRFRMLQPGELAKAQSFDDDYKFSGSREDVVKQIGNSVCPVVAEALVLNLLRVDQHITDTNTGDRLAA